MAAAAATSVTQTTNGRLGRGSVVVGRRWWAARAFEHEHEVRPPLARLQHDLILLVLVEAGEADQRVRLHVRTQV